MAKPSRKLCAIVSADVVGYSRLMQSDEAATVVLLKEYRTAITRIVERHKGRVVNAPGDALLAEFPSAVEAVEAAVEMQHCVAGRNLEIAPERRMQFRIGANLGDVIEEADGSLYGDGVNIAARMESLAEAGGICVSGAVHSAVDGKVADVQFEPLGPQQVKNIAKPIDVYKVRAAGAKRVPKRAGRWTFAVAGGTAVVAAALVVLIAALRPSAEQAAGSAVPERAANATQSADVLPSSVAVLPFENLGPDGDDAYFAAGIHEEVLSQLAKLDNLNVISRTSVARYANTDLSIPQIAAELRVGAVMEGSVRYANDRVRIAAQLVDAASDRSLWSDVYERDFADVFAIQADIAMNIANALQAEFSVAEQQSLEREPTSSPAAYALFLEAISGVREYIPGSIETAHALLDRAIAVDPNFARIF